MSFYHNENFANNLKNTENESQRGIFESGDKQCGLGRSL